jgi:pepF/M3 family oligoendopeptidase
MAAIFPSLQSREFEREFELALEGIGALAAAFERLGIRRRDTSEVDRDWVQSWEEVTGQVNALRQRLSTLGSYLHCLVSTDATDEEAKARRSRLEVEGVRLAQMESRLVAWIGSSDIETLLQLSPLAREHEFFLRRAQVLGKHQMSEAEEDLAAALRPMGQGSWGRLHANLSALLTATVPIEGEAQVLPISAVRSLASHGDRGVRAAAFEAELQAWQSVSETMAAAMNGIKGFGRTLREKRGYADDIEPTLISNSIDRATLEAMQSACAKSFPDFRRYMDAKARALKIESLAWYDLLAPIESTESAVEAPASTWSWDEAESVIEETFATYSPRLAAFARRSFDERWIDVAPRVGKEGGAYCTGIRPGESRIMMNFDGSFTGVSTLAHELGHGYHNLNLAFRTPLQRQVPMTLAETASIFCETLVFEAQVARAGREERIALLDNALSRDLQVVVDIHSRFLFEQAVFEARGQRELSPGEMCELMTHAQRATYGENLDPLHPWMWAVKGHYYGSSFYNYPYTFGLLFGLGLYARYLSDREAFQSGYDEFLSQCGMADARTLAQNFNIDITGEEFWAASLDVIRGQISEFESLIAAAPQA